MQQDVTVYFTDGSEVYARGVLSRWFGVIRITRTDGARVTIPSRSIRFIKSYPVKEDVK